MEVKDKFITLPESEFKRLEESASKAEMNDINIYLRHDSNRSSFREFPFVTLRYNQESIPEHVWRSLESRVLSHLSGQEKIMKELIALDEKERLNTQKIESIPLWIRKIFVKNKSHD
jgi:hypothetical protein